MNFQIFVALYLISVPVFFLIDMIWLGFVARDFYQTRLGHLLGETNWIAGIIFYLVFLLGLTWFATYPATLSDSFLRALALGALFGFFTYSTYDLTNLATLRNWPLSLSIIDIIWGTVLGALVTVISSYLYSLFA
jgi:uncharacterized membrane protein